MRSIPSPSPIKDNLTRQVAEAVVDALSILGRLKGKIRDSAVLVSDLVDLGIIGIYNDKTLYNPSSPSAPKLVPEPVVVPQGGAGNTLTVSVSGTGTTRTISLSIDTGGFFVVRLWLTDTTNPAKPTVVPPTGGDKVDWMIVTASDGTYTEDVTNTTVKDWYVNGMIVGKIDSGTLLSFT